MKHKLWCDTLIDGAQLPCDCGAVDPEMEGGYFGTCDWGDCDRPANTMRMTEDGAEWLPVCDNHSIPGEVAAAVLQALQDLYDDWNGPLTEAVKNAQAILQAAHESIRPPA